MLKIFIAMMKRDFTRAVKTIRAVGLVNGAIVVLCLAGVVLMLILATFVPGAGRVIFELLAITLGITAFVIPQVRT